jgi:hypothetical protein
MQLQIWTRTHDVTCDAAAKHCRSEDECISHHPHFESPHPIIAFSPFSMTHMTPQHPARQQRLGVLGCMMRVMVMHQLAHGLKNGLSAPHFIIHKSVARKIVATMIKHDAASRAPKISFPSLPSYSSEFIPPPPPPPPCTIC